MSLNSLNNKDEKNIKDKDSNANLSQQPKKEFSKADFFVFWQKYIDILDKQGDRMLASILNSSKPILKNTEASVTYPNDLMLKEVQKNQKHILNYLRNKLENHQISLKLILNEADEKKYVYTPEEKYSKLRETNPLLDELRKTLYLDL